MKILRTVELMARFVMRKIGWWIVKKTDLRNKRG